MITIGLTGSIGMGKTETSKIFLKFGVPVFDSDAAVHKLLGPDGEAVDLVEKEFPGVRIDNAIDRQKLGSEVLSDEKALLRLEHIIHPMVKKMRDDFVAKQDSDIVLFDIPLLFEKDFENDMDFVVVVSSPYEVQKERVLDRPGMTEQKFKAILDKQMPDSEKRLRADFIVQTDRGLGYAEDQVKQILEKVRSTKNA